MSFTEKELKEITVNVSSIKEIQDHLKKLDKENEKREMPSMKEPIGEPKYIILIKTKDGEEIDLFPLMQTEEGKDRIMEILSRKMKGMNEVRGGKGKGDKGAG